ncbi:MAG: hypothetical protein CV090_07975 [Nitrospira sp. WS238]|nr:hypothetical protein [Nitrospira sp. WS238]
MRQTGWCVLLSVLTLSACQNMPMTTHSGDIKDILITDRPASAAFEVHVGDEIRWTNTSMGPVRIVFMERMSSQVSCRRNFCGYFTGGLETVLEPNESASLCFGKPGDLQYTITMQSFVSHEPISRPGSIQVGVPRSYSSP